MWPRFGIKIGNSTVCVASAKDDGKIEVIANKHGNRVSQAVLLADGDEIEVGLTARQKLTSKSSSCVSNNFQLFSNELTDEEIDNALKYITCGYDKENGRYELIAQGQQTAHRTLTPYEVCVEFFKASFELARQCHLLDEHPAVVLSIPYYYSQDSWSELANSAEEAGFSVAQVIPEPTAAVLAYDLADSVHPKRVLCIKSGNLLTSFTLFEVRDGLVSVIDSSKPFYIGGKQVTDVLAEFISKEFYKKYRLDSQESRRSIAKIHNAAENCKHILTTLPSTQIYIDSLMDGVDFNVQMSRARLESLIQPVLNEFMAILSSTLEKLNSDKASIDEIVIAGGNMKIPKLQTMISARFPDAKLNNQHPPDEVVAIGCAKQSLYVDPLVKDLEPYAKCAFTTSDILIWHDKESKQILAKKGTLLPNQTVLDVMTSSEDEPPQSEVAVFHVRINDEIGEIKVCDATLDKGAYRLRANIEEYKGQPRVTLSLA